MQLAYRIPPNRAQAGTRAAKWINPDKNEILIPNAEAARAQIKALEKALEKALKPGISKNRRAELLIARAMIFEALGTPDMLKAAQDAWDCTKTAITAHLMAVAYHHLGDIPKACDFYYKAHAYPHEAGFSIDLAYTQALLFEGRWTEAHKETLKLKKRMVYAAYLPEWDQKPCKELSLISEGGFGDLIHTGRWIPILREMVDHLTVYLPPYFFQSGFVDIFRRQKWCPEIKLLTEVPQKVPAVGFFDLPAVFNVQPDNIPEPLTFEPDPERAKKYAGLKDNGLPQIGFCWYAKQQETPLVPSGVYRALTNQQADKIIAHMMGTYRFVKLQTEPDDLLPMARPTIENWEDTCALVSQLDAVVSVDTAVMHLAASMGKPTYVPLSGAYDWKFGLSEETTPWYPTARLFKNNAFGFNKAVDGLIEFLNAEQHLHG